MVDISYRLILETQVGTDKQQNRCNENLHLQPRQKSTQGLQSGQLSIYLNVFMMERCVTL